MIISEGYGFSVLIIIFLISLSTEFLSEFISGNEEYYQENPILISIAIFISGLIIRIIGKKLNGKNARILIDKENGEEVILKNNHSLFFIPMEYWGIILIIGSILIPIFE